MNIANERKKIFKEYRHGLRIILIAILSLIVIFFMLQWEFMQTLTPFIATYIIILLTIFTMVIFIIVLIRLITMLIKKNEDNLIVNIIILVLCIFILFIPIDSYYEKIRFITNQERFNKAAIEMLDYSESINAPLPDKYKDLSRGGGEVQIIGEEENKIVLFYLYRGILDNYSVYIYVPNKSSYDTLVNEKNWCKIIKISNNWYYCSSK